MGFPFTPAGRFAVVTGGASGIGRALGALLAARGARHVALLDIHGAAAIEAADEINAGAGDVRATGFHLDATNEAELRKIVADLEERHGPIDFYASNAGINRGRGLGLPEDWRAVLDLNLMAHVNAARCVIPGMVARGAGHFVITASAAGLLTDLRSAPYAASKHAAVALAEWLAITHETDGITVSCICPEGVKTAMTSPDSRNAADGIGFMEASEAAEAILAGVEGGRFLILPHPRVAEFEARRANDRERWLKGMRRARERLSQAGADPT